MIESNAAAAGLSASAFLRQLGQGFEPGSVLDQDAVLALSKIAGNQGRLGGLLKQWLSERPGEGASEHDVATLLNGLIRDQAQLHERILKL